MALLGRKKTTIGLDIGSQSPAEIAVAIAAEIVSVQRKREAPSLSHPQVARV